jgi:sugar-specific transcriptional regulator TrmB
LHNFILLNAKYSTRAGTALQYEIDANKAKLLSSSKVEGLRYLMELGLARTQASIYLSLMLHGEADARLLASWTGLPRTEVYRTLNELQGKGMVDRQVGSLLKFSAVPPSICLQEVIDHKYCQLGEMKKSLLQFTREFEGQQEEQKESQYKIIIIENRSRIIAKIKQQHDKAKLTVDIISFLPRFLAIATECLDNYRKATMRGVKYRIILGVPDRELGLSDVLPYDIRKAHDNENTTIKIVEGSKKVNSAIFDGEETCFSYYPDRPITQSPLILTNHPCLVEFAQNSFEKMWNSL